MHLRVKLNGNLPVHNNGQMVCTQCESEISGEQCKQTMTFQLNQETKNQIAFNEFIYAGDTDLSREAHETLLCETCVNKLNWKEFYVKEIEPKQKRHVLSDYDSRQFAYGFAAKHHIFGGKELTDEQSEILSKEIHDTFSAKRIERYNIQRITMDIKLLLER